MFKNISKNKKLLVISDTGILRNEKGFRAFGPVVKELNHLLEIFDEITWIGFEKISQKNNGSYIAISNNKIKPILLKEVGGKSLKSKINILTSYPLMFNIILKEVKKHTFIHTRAPSNPALIAMFISLFYLKKKFWHKYAGSWIDNAPLFYKFQREVLKKMKSNSVITINGSFSNKKNIIPFENPCLDENDRIYGKTVLKNKSLSYSINFCFVGALTSKKGVDDIINAFKKIDSTKIGEIHFVGDSLDREKYLKESKNIKYKIVFHGFLEKNQVKNIYKKTHFILLPSKSEGFPKVIGEAMNYGAVPIVSNISCIEQYIKNNKNGFLLEKPFSLNLMNAIKESLKLENQTFLSWINFNYKLSGKFTYSYYNKRVKKDIFNIE
ncbi:glycosyltransferase [Polaribacter cellanae]|uniref:Glycosyltransferase family 4 protein n=1 Tax=Polaribacter cellanae TaxID=2818493 RepID=A0A975H733_9FLAO|nr:glycosyltransferase [Polaribacter cellanae]QTE23057.1 glycosyltransferase family 4 protein [Polaribacter cellanae]